MAMRASNGAPSVEQQPRYLAEASRRVQQELKPRLTQSLGEDGYAALADWSRSRAAVLDDAGMSHSHFFATKAA